MKFLKIALLSILFSFCISQSYADPSVLETFKGLGPVVIDPKFNPIAGAMAEPYLHGERYFGPYGANKEKENPLLKCIVKNRTNPQNNESIPDNCPQDAVTSLIQWLFPNATMDGNFAPNRRGAQFQDLVSTFGPATIGGILNAIAMAKGNYDENLELSIGKVILNEYTKSMQSLPQLTVLEKTIDPQQLKKEYEEKFINTPASENFKTFDSVQNYFKLSKNAKKQQVSKPTQEQMKIVNEYNNAVNPQVKEKKPPSPRENMEIDPTYVKQAELFARIVVGALQMVKGNSETLLIEEKIEENIEQTISSNISQSPQEKQEPYHPDIVEMALLHFAWTISKDKQDLVTLLTAMPSVVDSKQMEIYENSKDVYTEHDYLQLKSTFSGPDSLKGPAGLELAGILGFGFQYFEIKFPKKIGYTVIPLFKEKYDSANPNQERYEVTGGVYTEGNIPDCGESSLRTVLMFLLFNPQAKIFNIDFLVKNAQLKQLTIHPLLIDFFNTYFSPASAKSYGARADWLRTTSFLGNEISYVKNVKIGEKFTVLPETEINAGVTNMMKVLGVFLGLEPSTQSENLIDMRPLDTLLGLLSTNENKWEWQTSDRKKEISKEKDKDVNIVFYQNNKPIFTWIFMPGHFDTVVHLTPEANWLQETGQKLLESKEILPVYFPLFVDESFMPKNTKELNLSPENMSFLFYSRELQDVNTRMSVLKDIGNDSSESFVDLGKRVIDSLKDLALADENTRDYLIINSFKSNELGIYCIDILKLKGNEKFKGGKNNPLYLAVAYGKLEIVKYLVEKGADINVQRGGRWGYTPLHLAAQNRNLAVVKYLVENKADINAKDDNGNTPLHLVAENGNLEIVKYLLENKADINAKDDDGNTTLHLATQNENLEVIKYLVEEAKADINAEDTLGYTPLHVAAEKGNLEVVKYLVKEAKVNINAQDTLGYTPLHVAAKKGNLEVVKYLENISKMNN